MLSHVFFQVSNCTAAKHGESLGPEGRTVSASSKYRSYSSRHCLLALLPGDMGRWTDAHRQKEGREAAEE